MTVSQLKSRISDLLSANELEAALELLHQEVSADSLPSKSVISLKSDCAEMKQAIIQDRYPVENIKQAKSSLVSRILDLAGTLTEKDLVSFSGISSEQAAGPEVIIPVFFSRGSPFNEIQARFINYFTRKFEQHNLRLETPMWSSENPLLPVRQKMKEVFGCIVLALERLQSLENTYKKGSPKEEKINEEYFPTPWIQMEAAMAYQEELPLLIFSEAKLKHEGMIELGVHEFRIFKINPEQPEELDEEFFDNLIHSWADKVCKLYNQRKNKRG